MTSVISTLRGTYTIEDGSIVRIGTESKGLLIKKHYEDIKNVLFTADTIAKGNTYESIKDSDSEEKNLKHSEHLADCLDDLEHQLSLMTDGEYYELAKKFSEADSYFPDKDILKPHKYWGEIHSIWSCIKDLRNGKYYENLHQRGIPKISNVGDRIIDNIMDLIWKIDNNLPNKWDEIQMSIDEASRFYEE